MVIAGIGILYGIRYLRYQNDPEYQYVQNIEKIKQQEADDPYGGATPEETLRFFIDALKKGNIDLAAKYFAMSKQEAIQEELKKSQDKALLDIIINKLEKTKLTIKDDSAFFTLIDNNNIAISEMIMHQNVNKRWKIVEW